MRHVKTYEQFSYQSINEEEFLAKIKAWWQTKKQDLGKKMLESIESNPEAKAKLEEAKKEFAKLPAEDKARVQEIAKGENLPDPATDPGEKVNEGMQQTIGKILKWFGLGLGALSFIALLVAVIKLAIVGSGFVVVLGGLCTLGNLVGILMGATFGFGMVGAVGSGMED